MTLGSLFIKIKNKITAIETTIQSLSNNRLPIGAINLFGGETPPSGWLICNGQAISRITYSELFEILGTSFGSGDGSTTFNLPDFRNTFAIGSSGTKTLGSTGGEATHTLTREELPNHRHILVIRQSGAHATSSGAYIVQSTGWGYGTINESNANTFGSDMESVINQPHNNLPPYLAINYIIKAFNVQESPA